MGRLYVIVSDELEDRFRKEAGRRFGAKKGSVKKALREALELWVKTSKHKNS